jgi:hypothetical protein
VSSRRFVQTFPRHDEEFIRFVEETIEREDPADPEVLETLVTVSYPSARVVRRSNLGGLGNGVVWYAFRDGNAVSE